MSYVKRKLPNSKLVPGVYTHKFPVRGRRLFSSPPRSDRLWGPVPEGGSLPGGKAAGAWSWPRRY